MPAARHPLPEDCIAIDARTSEFVYMPNYAGMRQRLLARMVRALPASIEAVVVGMLQQRLSPVARHPSPRRMAPASLPA